jgi:hypothetical protein
MGPRTNHRDLAVDPDAMLVTVGTQLPAKILHDKGVHAQIHGRTVGQLGVDFVGCGIELPDPDDLGDFQDFLWLCGWYDGPRRRPDRLWIGDLGKSQ